MKNFLLVEYDGFLDEFIFNAAQYKDFNLFLVTSKLEEWIFKYIKKENIIITDTLNSKELVSVVKEFSRVNSIIFHGVGTFFECFVVNTSELSNELNLIGLPVEAAIKSSCNKLNMRLACKEEGINQPTFEVVSLSEIKKIKNFINKYDNCVIKPLSGISSIGVFKLNKNSNLEEIFFTINNQIFSAENNYIKTNVDKFLLEEYVPGILFSIDGVIQKNKIYFIGETEFFMGKEPQFIQEGGVTPTRFSSEQIFSVKKMVEKIIHTLSYNNCGFHCEIRMDNNTPVLIEIAARTPGGPILHNYNKAYGIDGVGLMFDIWMGKDIKPTKNINRYVLYKDVFSRRNGIISKICIPKNVTKLSFLIELILFVKEKENVLNTSFNSTTLYYYSVIGNNLNEVLKYSKYLEDQIKIEII